MALMPAGSATAAGHPDEPRDTDTACPGDYDNPYPDLSSANPHYDNIVCMTDYGIARGFTDGTYRPPSNVTRDQMATFIANLIREVDELPTGEHRFDDVGEESPHYQNIHDLAEAGVVLGYDADTYGPRDHVRRDQMASFIARAIDYVHNGEVDGSAPPQSEGADYFTDLFAANTHSDAIGALADAAIVVGYGDDTYGPRDLTRRDQMASFIMRALDYILEEIIDDNGVVEPADALILSAELDTPDTPPGAPVAAGDVWVLVFDQEMDTDSDGETITLADGDDTFTVECLEELDTPATGNSGATCTWGDTAEDDNAELTVTLLDAPEEDVSYAVEIIATSLQSAAGTDVDVANSPDTTIGEDVPPTPFTAFVETGALEIGDNAFEFPECPDGEPAEDDGECITFMGFLNDDGTHTVPAEGVSFPKLVTEEGGLTIAVNIEAPEGADGVFDIGTGLVTFDTDLDVFLDIGDNGTNDCRIDADIRGTTDESGGETGIPFEDWRAQIIDAEFAVPASTPVSPTGDLLCSTVDGALGLPSDGGENYLEFNLLFTLN
jgi:hypothetical protein